MKILNYQVMMDGDVRHVDISLDCGELYYLEKKDVIHLSVIEVSKRGEGIGTELLNDLKQIGKPIELYPVPFEVYPFYVKNGFKFIKENKMRYDLLNDSRGGDI